MLEKINWIVIGGGPGLSNNYLQYALEKIIAKDKMHFFAVAGSPESAEKDPSIQRMVNQISEVAKENGLQEYGLITHSFGNYLAMRALEKDQTPIQAVLMLNPIPFEFQAWQSALAELVRKVPEHVLDKIAALSLHPDQGAELFRIIYPYYIGMENDALPIEVPFDTNACNNISAKVKEYDDRNLITTTSIPLVRIMGDHDPFFYDHQILENRTIIMPKIGHYPFFENYERFFQAMQKAGELLCL